MKVVGSVRKIYDDRRPLYQKLKKAVDQKITNLKEDRWHYESRIKELESFNLKIETGRYVEPSTLEDFFAASIVVENLSSLQRAVNLIEREFEVVYRRPREPQSTHKNPFDFSFDDLRLYVNIPEAEGLRPKDYNGVLFELQIKTYLQHAWSIATHDLIYKSNEASWSASRIAHQVKAMLEHSELSILEAKSLSESSLLAMENYEYRDLTSIVNLIGEYWPEEQLPEDKIRVARNIREVFQKSKTNISKLKKICSDSTFIGDSPHKNLSPLIAVTLGLIEHYNGNIPMVGNWKRSGKPAQFYLPNEAIDLLSDELLEKVGDVFFTVS
ncbi:hypothetical protein [Arenicella xantha]|uniref:RelA/SpoT family protein n=1 Tax=Arenicella xantha TaxID=644221 RepID=A0A395JPS8_9GAMM|nr:hypothetical protein [Arenicella xantha]RBP53507.1 RelA/SpoT family protein [Arenicella xantha]